VDPKNDLGKAVARLGEPLYRCQPPTGYKETSETWVNPGALVSRINFGLALSAGRVPGVSVDLSPLRHDLAESSPDKVLANVDKEFFQRELSSLTKETVRHEIEREAQSMPDGETKGPDLAKISALLLGSPEFQRR
jgi:uncharacterized protein (DUF1800 family)